MCLVVVAEDAAAVERPTDPGPYKVGYFDVRLNATRDGQAVNLSCRYYYPATTDGKGAEPDPTGAPYPPIIYHIYFQGRVNSTLWNRTNDRERIEFVVSHGFVVLTFTPNHYAGPPPGVRSSYNDLVYHTDLYDANASSPLHGMIKKDAYGALGESWGGSVSFMHACTTDRIKALHSLGVVFGEYNPDIHDPYTRDWNRTDRVWMVQMGGDYTGFDSALRGQYEVLDPGKSIVTIPGGGQRGPYRDDLYIAFFKYHLGGHEEYETYIYGNESKTEVYTGLYGMEYERLDGSKFTWEPKFIIHIPVSCYMDDDVTFEVTCDHPDVILNHPTLVHEWYIGDTAEPYASSNTIQNLNITFTEPEEIGIVRYKYNIGNITIMSDVASIVVRNVWPVAEAGPPNLTIYQDDQFNLDGSLSSDTPSDIDSLNYSWTFSGIQSGWSTDPTYVVDTSRIREFTAYLDVRDQFGKQTQDNITIEIINVQPVVILIVSDVNYNEDDTQSLTGVWSDSRSHNLSMMFRWDFGDDSGTEWNDSPNATHSYRKKGTYDAILWVIDPEEAMANDTIQITIENVVPEGGIDEPEDGAEAPIDSMLEFTCWSWDTPSDNDSLWYNWDFGDGRTAGGAEVSHTYKEAGTYTVTLTVEDDDGATSVVTHNLTIEAAEQVTISPIVVSVGIGFAVILGLAVVAATEPGKYSLGLLSAPLFTKTKDVLDNKTRYALHGVIVEKPGIHYSAIREEFGLANGAAAYHLDVLERRKFIRSVRDGKLKRFYSTQEKLPEDVGRSPEGTREAIEELVRERPGIKQLEVMEELGLDRNAASYYLRELVKEGRLTSRKKGWYTVYTVNGRK